VKYRIEFSAEPEIKHEKMPLGVEFSDHWDSTDCEVFVTARGPLSALARLASGALDEHIHYNQTFFVRTCAPYAISVAYVLNDDGSFVIDDDF